MCIIQNLSYPSHQTQVLQHLWSTWDSDRADGCPEDGNFSSRAKTKANVAFALNDPSNNCRFRGIVFLLSKFRPRCPLLVVPDSLFPSIPAV